MGISALFNNFFGLVEVEDSTPTTEPIDDQIPGNACIMNLWSHNPQSQ
jgi:hypothetical protein